MCLERKCWLKPKHSGEGWRAFGVTEGNGLKSLYFSMFRRSFPIDKWVHKREFSLYPISPGFYIFKVSGRFEQNQYSKTSSLSQSSHQRLLLFLFCWKDYYS